MTDYSCVYLVKEREFTKTNENIIKVGYSNQENLKRFKQYPKDSVLLCQVFTENGKLCESKILDEFKIKFKHRKDIGNEYFEGDYILMRQIINDIVDKVEKENKNIFKNIVDELENKIKELEELQNKYQFLIKEYEELKNKQKEFDKYKLFYIKNNGTDAAQTTNDRLKLFISTNYEITTNHKDRIRTSELFDEYSKISQMDIKIFLAKMKDIGIETIRTNGYNNFINIKKKNIII
jgi:hypothetical protein